MLSFNPFNPLKTYRQYTQSQQITLNTEQKLIQPKMVRIKGNSLEHSSEYIKKLKEQRLISARLLKQHKVNNKADGQDSDNKKLQMDRIKLLLEQENAQLAGGLEREEFEKQKQKQIRVWKIKNFVPKTKRLKIQHQVTEMVNEIKNPAYQNVGRYLLNNDKDREKKLFKPLFFGIQGEPIKKKKKVFVQIEMNEIREKRIFHDFDIFEQQNSLSEGLMYQYIDD